MTSLAKSLIFLLLTSLPAVVPAEEKGKPDPSSPVERCEKADREVVGDQVKNQPDRKKIPCEVKKKEVDRVETPGEQEADYGALAGNPAAVNLFNGTGKLGEFLGIAPETGVQFGGLLIGNTAFIMGGQGAGNATYNNLAIVDLQVDLEKFWGLSGASFAATFLQFDGGFTNSHEGVAIGFDGLTEGPPLNRSELYQLWWRQKLLDDTLILRLGKSIPYLDFGNVIKALPIDRERSPPMVPAVTALIYAPIFVNPTMLGVMPGYYNSAWGVTGSFIPNDYYASVGVFDGSLARGRQTGDYAGPALDGYYFSIGEVGKVWGGDYPGKMAFGGWGQSGAFCAGLTATKGCEGQSRVQNGMQGFYTLLTNRVMSVDWANTPGAIIGFMQFGINNSQFMLVNQFVGGGLSAFGVIPDRDRDSLGLGFGLSYMNPIEDSITPKRSSVSYQYPFYSRTNELVTQLYYQAHVFGDLYIQPVLSYVPHPALNNINATPMPYTNNSVTAYPASTSAVVELIALF
jgi:porin